MVIRKAELSDINSLIKLRIDYLTEDKGKLSLDEKANIETQLIKYFNKHIPDNTFIGILAEIDGNIVSSAFLAISEKPVNTVFITGLTGTILNVLTYPNYRRKGIATKVIKRIIEEAKQAGVSSISLSATNDGKPLYEKLGFTVTKYTEMNIRL